MMKAYQVYFFILLFVDENNYSFGYENGLGLSPPLGWNSWNFFHCNLNEDLIRETAKAMVDLGLKDVGYEYINLDDCWQVSRDEQGYIEEDREAFPSGMAALSDYVHSLGLKFGLYSDAGTLTCQGRPGSLGFESQDAETYSRWKIDYLKYDNCHSTDKDVKLRYKAMRDALNATGRPIFFSMCEWGRDQPATWANPIANSWRTTGDIRRSWDSVMSILDSNDQWHSYAGPGGWNDPDMLEIGPGDNHTELTLDEQRSHFTLWCLIKAPLLLGNDLRNISNETLQIITNEELIAINQDPLGEQGYRRSSDELLQIWAGKLSHDEIAVVLLNRSPEPALISATFQEINATDGLKYNVRDLWAHLDLGIETSKIEAWVESHGVFAGRLSPLTIS